MRRMFVILTMALALVATVIAAHPVRADESILQELQAMREAQGAVLEELKAIRKLLEQGARP